MKKKYLLIGSLVFMSWGGKAQTRKDTTAQVVDKVSIEAVYNHYIQSGNNSAITGGIGTESLVVYGPSLQINKTGKNTLSLQLGTDIISSASTDNINFVKSSASIRDLRYYSNISYEKKFAEHKFSLITGLSFSAESDYTSFGSKLGFVKEDKSNTRVFSAIFQMFNDDLRWGRRANDFFSPQKLVYPAELRYKEWYDVYRRHSFNLKLGLSQIINKRNVLGVYSEVTYQKGLLATPFHRVYFTDGQVVVEQLPQNRWKGSVALKLNTFVGGRVVVKNTLNPYLDSFGILALAVENETVIKLSPNLKLLPNIRIYSQKGSLYFDGYMKHSDTEQYYTSDYDLSSFKSYNLGMGTKYNFEKPANKRFMPQGLIIRYNYYYRTTNMHAHIMSLAWLFE